MEGSIANELYSGIATNSTSQSFSTCAGNGLCNTSGLEGDDDDLWYDDGHSFEGAVDCSFKASDLDREWLRRHDQFHTVGYREGLMAGKEAAAQEGFNIGFKESVFTGHGFGLVRGVTSALACLPDGLRERLIKMEETRIKFRRLHESVHPLSTTDALKLFYDGWTNSQTKSGDAKTSDHVEHAKEQSSDINVLKGYQMELQSLILESPAVKLRLDKE